METRANLPFRKGSFVLTAFVSLLLFSGCTSQNSSTGTGTNATTSQIIRFSEHKLDYDWISEFISVGGKPAFVADKSGKKLIVYDGAEIDKDYSLIWSLTDIGGKLAYLAKKEGDYYVVYDGREYGPYENVFKVRGVAGKLTYSAKKNGKWLVYYDGKEYGREYDHIGYRFPATERDCLMTTNTTAWDCGSYEVNGTTNYYLIRPAFEEVDGKLAYFAGLKDKTFIVYDGKEIGAQYSPVGPYITYDENGTERDISSVGGKLLYSAFWGEHPKMGPWGYYTIWGDKELGNEIRVIKEINGKVAYIAQKGNKETINLDGREIVSGYDLISNFHDLDGKLAYVGIKDMGVNYNKVVYVVGDQQLGSEYDSVLAVKMLGGKMLFRASRNYKTVLVYAGKEIIELDAGDSVEGDLQGVSMSDGKLNMIVRRLRDGYYSLKEE